MPLTVGAPEACGHSRGRSGRAWRAWCRGPTPRVSIFGARICGHCRNCREGRDNLCEHVEGVHGFHLDGFAQEKMNLPARQLVPAPPGVDVIGAAWPRSLSARSSTCCSDNAKLQPGETILIHAGGSGIGSAALQLARRMGCTVITTVGSNDKIEKAMALGGRSRSSTTAKTASKA